jgi:SecD/SecF fusion protein
MKNAWLKLLLVLVVTAFCGWQLAKNPIRLGKDLRGGVSLIYSVKVPDNQPAEEVLGQVIDVLKQRVNPQGVLDIGMQPQGNDRIEVVMPLPNAEVRALQVDAKSRADAFLAKTRLSPLELDAALLQGTAVSRFGTLNPRIAELEAAWQELQLAKSDLEALGTGGDAVAIGAAEDRFVAAELRADGLRAEILGRTLDPARLSKALNLPTRPLPERDADGKAILDADGAVKMGASAREREIAAIKSDFPSLAAELDELVAANDVYISKRSGLDDPEDLMRLLRGAGVLDFRIAVTPTATMGVSLADMRADLAERGGRAGEPGVARWFKLNDLKQWYEKPADLEALRTDPAAYFAATYNLVAGENAGEYFILLWDDDARAMTHRGGASWGLTNAFRTVDSRLGAPAVGFSLDTWGGQRMSQMTGSNVGEPMAIVLDDQVFSAPRLNTTITDSGVISGNFSPDDIAYLIRVLTAGSLQAKVSSDPISINILGPSIGADNLERGLEATVLSVAITCVVMVLYYFFAGLVADVALAVNALLIFGVMAVIDGTFTLPGLAGIALSIAMGVDANVLIYERIREELQDGNPLRAAVATGYKRALSAIIDGNITNLIVCLVLYKVGATEVKGFALTMTIGIATTLFTAIFLTRAIYEILLDRGLRSLPMLPMVVPAVGRFIRPNIDWVRLRPTLFVACGAVFLLSLASVVIRGNDIFETEFRGGVAMTLSTREAMGGEPAGPDGRMGFTRAEVEERVRAVGKAAAGDIVVEQLASANVLTVGEKTAEGLASSFQIRVGNPPRIPEGFDESRITRDVQAAVVEAFKDDLDIRLPLSFALDASDDHTKTTRPLEKALVGRSIGRDGVANEPVGAFKGGVAILIDGITDPVTTDDVADRILRMRQQPDWSSTAGRNTRVVGLEPADPSDPAGLQKAVAVLVFDPELSSTSIGLETWDRDLAAPEWRLVREALTQQASLDQVSSFSPIVAENLAASAIVAVILSLIGMLAYIWVRFGSFRFSTSAVTALAFDVTNCLGFLAISIPLASTSFGTALFVEEYRIDLNVVAGLLTIIGYSLNDSIVILDRIRENRGKRAWISADTVNLSINQTFSRTLLTSGTTLVAAIVLISLGGTGIRPFAYTFFIGLVSGTASSVIIAAPMVYSRKEEEIARARAAIAPTAAAPQPA